MINFIDTNIALGYSLKCDKWHDVSQEFISKNQDIYWSDCVKKEFNIKFRKIITMIIIFLQRINIILKNNITEFINYSDFEKFILNNTKHCKLDLTKKIKVIEYFWNENNISANDSTNFISIKFNNFLIRYAHIKKSLKKEFESLVHLYNCGMRNYLNYPIIIDKLKELGVHKPDYIIVIDAHDFAISQDVCFNTTDEELYNLAGSCELLKINEFKLLS